MSLLLLALLAGPVSAVPEPRIPPPQTQPVGHGVPLWRVAAPERGADRVLLLLRGGSAKVPEAAALPVWLPGLRGYLSVEARHTTVVFESAPGTLKDGFDALLSPGRPWTRAQRDTLAALLGWGAVGVVAVGPSELDLVAAAVPADLARAVRPPPPPALDEDLPPGLCARWAVPGQAGPGWPALLVLAESLNAFSGRVQAALREQQGLTYAVRADLAADAASGRLTVCGSSRRPEALRRALTERLLEIGRTGLRPDEVDAARRALLLDAARTLASPEVLAEQLAAELYAGNPPEAWATRVDALRALDAARTNAVVQPLLSVEPAWGPAPLPLAPRKL